MHHLRMPLPKDATAAKPGTPSLPPRKYWPWLFLVLLLNYMLVTALFPKPGNPLTVPYTVFREQVTQGNVLAIYSRGTTIEGRFQSPVTWPTPEEVKQAGQTPPRTPLDRRLLPPPRTSLYFTTSCRRSSTGDWRPSSSSTTWKSALCQSSRAVC